MMLVEAEVERGQCMLTNCLFRVLHVSKAVIVWLAEVVPAPHWTSFAILVVISFLMKKLGVDEHKK
jgi:hypothetical protein